MFVKKKIQKNPPPNSPSNLQIRAEFILFSILPFPTIENKRVAAYESWSESQYFAGV